MARPKMGEPGCEQATKKWRESMIKKYGSAEKVHEVIIENGRKGGAVAGVRKGFAVTGIASEAGRKGGKASKRGPKLLRKVKQLENGAYVFQPLVGAEEPIVVMGNNELQARNRALVAFHKLTDQKYINRRKK